MVFRMGKYSADLTPYLEEPTVPEVEVPTEEGIVSRYRSRSEANHAQNSQAFAYDPQGFMQNYAKALAASFGSDTDAKTVLGSAGQSLDMTAPIRAVHDMYTRNTPQVTPASIDRYDFLFEDTTPQGSDVPVEEGDTTDEEGAIMPRRSAAEPSGFANPVSVDEFAPSMYAPVGAEYNEVADHSYYDAPIQGEGPRGNSRVYGDASQDVQEAAMQAIINAGLEAGMTSEQIARTLAIARVESGFNPDAAAGTTSAHGLGQMINRTGEAYGLTDENRWDINAQARALVAHTLDNYRLAERKGYDEEYVYAFHHDGPSLRHGGIDISREKVEPLVDLYRMIVQDI